MSIHSRNFCLSVLLLVIFILPACASFNAPPLIKATDQGLDDRVRQLLAEGKDVNMTTGSGASALLIAAAGGHREIAEYLIDQGADVDATVTKTFEKDGRTFFAGTTPLLAALGHKHPEVGHMLVQNGADVNKSDINGTTPLFAAAQNDAEIVAILLQAGANANTAITQRHVREGKTVYKGTTPLMAALAKGKRKAARSIMDAGVDVTVRNEVGNRALIIAAAHGTPGLLWKLLVKGAERNTAVTEDFKSFTMGDRMVFEGCSPLMAAAYAGKSANVKLLIDVGADLNAKNRIGWTPLMAAASEGDLASVTLLVEKGAEVNAKTTEKFEKPGGIEIFHGAPLIIPKGWSPIASASYNGHAAVVQYLIDHGADISIKDDKWRMDPLFLGAYRGHLDVVKVLLANGADPFALSKRGTAYNCAKIQDKRKILECIKEARQRVKEEEGGE